MRSVHSIIRLSVLLGTLFLIGCSPGPELRPTVLTEADSLSASDPVCALAMLDSVAPQLLAADSATLMYYQLLRVKAQDRAYIRHTSDQPILSVISYYERHPEADLLAWAYCYGGRVCRDLGETPRALRYFEKALAELADGRNPDLRRRVLSQLGYLFYYQYLFAESRAIKREVIGGDSLAGRYDRMVTCYTDIARCYLGEAQYDSAALVARHAGALVVSHGLSRQQPAIDLLLSQVAAYRAQPAEALRCVTPYLSDTTLADATPYLAVAIRALMDVHRYAEALPLCHRLLSQPQALAASRATVLRDLAVISQHEGRQAEALAWQSEALALLDTMRQAEAVEKMTLVSNYYRSQQRERELARLEQAKSVADRRLYVVSSLLLCLLLAAGLSWLHYKWRRAEGLLSRERSLAAFRGTELCQRIYELCYAQRPLSAELWDEVEAYIGQSSPVVLSQLRRLTSYSETEWRLTLLTRLGFRNVDIATLLCKHRSAVSQAKKRLYTKVRGTEGKAEDWDRMVREV